MQVYLAESLVVYDGSSLKDMLAEDTTSKAAASSTSEEANVLGNSASGVELDPKRDAAAASISDAYGNETLGGVGSTPVRGQCPELSAGFGGDGSSGTPLNYENTLTNTVPLDDPMRFSGEEKTENTRTGYLVFDCVETRLKLSLANVNAAVRI